MEKRSNLRAKYLLQEHARRHLYHIWLAKNHMQFASIIPQCGRVTTREIMTELQVFLAPKWPQKRFPSVKF